MGTDALILFVQVAATYTHAPVPAFLKVTEMPRFSWSEWFYPNFSQTSVASGRGRLRHRSQMASIEQLETRTLLSANQPPDILGDQEFSVLSTSPNGTLVGTVEATDPDNLIIPQQDLSFRIAGGNANGAFSIEAGTGRVRVANQALVAAMTAPAILTIIASDNGTPELSDSSTFTIYVNHPPAFTAKTYSFFAAAGPGDVVGTVSAKDTDPGQTLSYSILAGNIGGLFALDGATGQLKVTDPTAFAQLSFPVTLSIKVQDNGYVVGGGNVPNPLGNDTATITIERVNHAPVLNDKSIDVPGTLPVNTIVGTATAKDIDPITVPEGQLTYSLLPGIAAQAFAINPTTGAISVSDVAAYNALPVVVKLTLQVEDGGELSDTAIITITKDQTGLALADESRTYRSGDAPVRLDPQAIFQLASNLPSTQTFENTKLTVTLKAGGLLKTSGKLQVVSDKAGTGRISVVGKSIVYGQTVIGTVARNREQKHSIVIQFNSAATTESIQALVRRIGFSVRGAGQREIELKLTGIPGLTANSGQSKIVNVVKS